jgi:predicted aconitase
MKLNVKQREMLNGGFGKSTQKAMEILVTLGTIYNAEYMIPVTSDSNLGEAGLQFLTDMADGGGQARVLTTLNPAGMDIDNWQKLGIDEEFARNQERVLNAFSKMGIITTCTCTPYLIGNTPHFGEHIAWSESSAVCYANSVLGARTNREGGPSALASALTGYTPAYGYHLDENRIPEVTFEINHRIDSNHEYGALGKVISEHLEKSGKRSVPYIMGIENASVENLKSFCASIATYAGTAVFHMDGITPEAAQFNPTNNRIVITREDIHGAYQSMNEVTSSEIDFVSLGCPQKISMEHINR